MRKLLLLLGTAFSFVPPVAAEPITLSGTGTLDEVCGSCAQQFLGISLASGDPFGFTFSLGTVSADIVPDDPGFGRYGFIGSSLTLTLGTHTFEGFSVSAFVEDDPSGDLLVLLTTDLPGFPQVLVDVFGRDPTGKWLSSDVWPTDVATTLNTAPERFFRVTGIDDAGDVHPVAEATPGRITQEPAPAPIPEPATLLLLGSALLGASGARRWHQRRRFP